VDLLLRELLAEVEDRDRLEGADLDADAAADAELLRDDRQPRLPLA